MNKITVIGSGNVGSTIAYTLTIMGIASEIVMIDVNEEKSLGEALDIRQGVSFCSPTTVYAGSYDDAKNSDIVVTTRFPIPAITTNPARTKAYTGVNDSKTLFFCMYIPPPLNLWDESVQMNK